MGAVDSAGTHGRGGVVLLRLLSAAAIAVLLALSLAVGAQAHPSRGLSRLEAVCARTRLSCPSAARTRASARRLDGRRGRHAAGTRPAVTDGGAISGTVTDASTEEVLPGIEVCAYELGAFEEEGLFEGEGEVPVPTCQITGASGEYELKVSAGEYLVEFWDPNSTYVTQYWEGAESPELAEIVEVEVGEPVTGIDAAMVEGGRIEGTVKSAGKPVAGILACAFDTEEEFAGGCATTGPDGKYLIGALPEGSYEVGFLVPQEPGFNYISRLLGAELTVQLKKTTQAGTVELAAGGQIEGLVTAASSGAPLPGVEVCAIAPPHFYVECTVTARNGEYVLERLPSDSYKVEFSASPTYLTQFYLGKAEFFEAVPIAVVAGGAPVSGIDAVMHTVAPEPQPVTVQPPAPQPPPPAISVLSTQVVLPSLTAAGTVRVAGRRATVKLHCAVGPCHGTLQLMLTLVRRHRSHGHTVVRHVSVVVGTGTFSLAQGATGNATIHLTAQGRALLRLAARHPRAGKLKLALQGASAGVRVVVVR